MAHVSFRQLVGFLNFYPDFAFNLYKRVAGTYCFCPGCCITVYVWIPPNPNPDITMEPLNLF